MFTTYKRKGIRFVGYECNYIQTPFQTEQSIAPEPGGGGGGSDVEPPEEEPKPCESKDKKRSNPLVVMALAPTSGDKYSAGRYGYTRSNGKKMHNGIDLYAEVGTPVYAMMDGIVTRVVDCQPNRSLSYGTASGLPIEYEKSGKDKNDAGNRITIRSTYNNDTIEHSYWHLQAETPIAINPSTQKTYKVGDKVLKGTIIGYTGITGNAYSVPNPHLHLNIRKNGKSHNPEDYLEATVKNQSKIDTPCDE